MDILLIEPPQSILKGMPTERGYNIGLTSLAAYLRKEGIDTAVLMGELLVDAPPANPLTLFIRELRTTGRDLAEGQRKIEDAINDKNHIVWKKLVEAIRQANPGAVGISYLTPLKYIVERVAALVKEINPDIKIVVGSFHPTFCPDEVMQNQYIDFVVRGEGEIPLLQLMKEIKKDRPNWENVPGIHYRDGDGQLRSNPATEFIKDLNELPFPARDLVLNCDYNIHRSHSISTVRGCPYNCSFCADRKFWGGKIRRRSVDNVIGEIMHLKATYTVDVVDFVDGTFTYDRNYLQQFCEAVIDRRLNVNWRCTARYDNLDENILKLMKRANCTGMYLGLESGSNRVLKAINKKETVENIIEVNKMVYNSGIPTITSVLLGMPDEDNEDIEATLKLMKHFKTDFLDVNSYMPLPGSPLYDSLGEDDKANIDWRKISMKSFDNYFSNKMSQDEFKEYLVRAHRIADNLRRKSIIRFGSKMLFHWAISKFKKSGEESPSPFSYS